jgi:hypothetical protein
MIRQLTLALVASTVAHTVAVSEEIPAFARRYRVSCSLCHSVVPKLTAFGDVFAGNGFRMSAEEPARDTIDTGDALLELARELPLAIRLDAYMQAYSNGSFATDLQTPYNVKILSGGTISRRLSYYLYFFLFERGEVGGIEDAFVQVNDVAGIPLDVTVGQFQVSDPLFKRELRLEFEDYAIYRVRVGDQPADLTYDRGVAAAIDATGFTVTGLVVNGNGRGPAQSNRRLDNDLFKNFFGHVTRDLTPNLRLGAMGYYGHQRGEDFFGLMVDNRVWMIGGDLTATFGPVELNGQFIHREDNLPTFTLGEPKAVTNGGFAELIVHRPGARWYGFGLYNLVDANRALLNVRLGGPANVERYHTLTGGVGYLVRRNFRVTAEGTWDLELEQGRWSLGLTTAF